MATPTQVRLDLKEQEVERLNADVKRRISELQLAILSGKLSDEDLKKAGEELATVRKQLLVTLDTTLKEATGRRVRQAEEQRQQPA
jgi:hypothetical protein